MLNWAQKDIIKKKIENELEKNLGYISAVI
jgi:hypothetical protein